MTYLTQWLDTALDIPAGVTSAAITAQEIARLVEMVAVAATAMEIPRRLGGDATDEELAADKRRGKRVGYAAGQCLKLWAKDQKIPAAPDVRKKAAIVDWPRWWAEHCVWLLSRRAFIATWACRIEEADQKWAKSAVVKINNELSWLEYAMR